MSHIRTFFFWVLVFILLYGVSAVVMGEPGPVSWLADFFRTI